MKPENIWVDFLFPTPEHPFYQAKVSFTLEGDELYQVKKVHVNGVRVRDFSTYHNAASLSGFMVKGGGLNEVVIRCDWKASEEYVLELSGSSEDGKKSLSLKARATAPNHGGYWDPAWQYFAGIVCTETAGLDRVKEPVHTSLAVYGERIQDPERELRLVYIDHVSGEHREIPCQVSEVNRYTIDGLEHLKETDEFFDVRYRSTTTFQVAFLADVPAGTSQVYLAFYGNPEAPVPAYKSTLTVAEIGLGITVENKFYKALMAPTSGAIDEIHMKMGVNRKFYHHLETNGALHWNPGLYAPPKMWLHASDWDPPAHYELHQGPVFVSTKRSGPFPHYEEETDVSITYWFYEGVPWIRMSSKIEVKKDIAVKALRNGELVMDRKLVKEFAWRKPDGTAGTMPIESGPRHPQHAKVLPYDTPWACLFDRESRSGLGMITSKMANFRLDGGNNKRCRNYCYLQWGPWVYYARPLVYTFATNNPGKLIHVPAGNIYYEEMAFVPLTIDPVKEDFQALERLYMELDHPLDVQIVEDTDPGAPEGWMPPVLVGEFEEMED